jgi:DNA polymerase-3 subunit epsilon
MYAIVDIETTGGHASANGITEIAIVLYNGRETEGRYHTLVNPGVAIPRFITVLTGITNEMVAEAPSFAEIAGNIFNLLEGRVFIAHNVNFDYSFVRYHLMEAGFDLNSRKLCTVRMSRKVFPGLASYSLGNLCRQLHISITNRHRAMGDALATVQLFELLLQEDREGVLGKMIKGKNKEQYLPPHLPEIQVDELPTGPGVYYFHDSKDKIIYVGKAVNLQQRVKSHFSNNDGSRRKQDLLRNVYRISCRECSSELAALILESVEIRRLWPQYNRSQKKYHYEYGLYTFEDQNGYQRLFIERKKKNLASVYTFNLLHEGQVVLRKMIEQFGLDAGLCFVNGTGRQEMPESPQSYNKKVAEAIQSLQEQLPSFVVTDGDTENASCIVIERGRFIGMGQLTGTLRHSGLEQIKQHITLYPDNDYIRGLVYEFTEKHPEKKFMLTPGT